MIMAKFWSILLFHATLHFVFTHSQDADFWNNQAQESLAKALELEKLNQNVAENLIMFIGDGMGVSTVTAARIRKGQLLNNAGEETVLSMEEFPHIGLSKTYNTDAQVSDSAGTATAYLCGVKSKSGTLGVNDDVIVGDCESIRNAHVDSFLRLAKNQGKSVGVVTTTRVTHATPAAAYAHVPHRNWESNEDVPASQSACKDIALQLIEDNRDFDVILGGGRKEFMPSSEADPEYPSRKGDRTDDKNLIAEWEQHQENQHGNRSAYVWNKLQFDSLDIANTDYLLGLFEPSHMQYSDDIGEDGAGEPTLSEMVETAIRILQKNENGFALLAEGGRIDHAHHDTNAHRALGDTIALDDAIAKARQLTNAEDTLIVVTADHSHTLTINGYPSRGNPILGINDDDFGTDGLPYTTLGYANGISGQEVADSFKSTGKRPNISDPEEKEYLQQSLVPLSYETHAGEDVSIFALGPMSHLFHGIHEQNYIMHAMKYAACLGDSHGNCDRQNTTTSASPITETTANWECTCTGTSPTTTPITLYATLLVVFLRSYFY